MGDKNIGGRPALFSPKDGRRIQGPLTTPGTELFEQRRRELQDATGFGAVSDADVVESFMRPRKEVAAAVRARRKARK
jgi:hypothetical protein